MVGVSFVFLFSGLGMAVSSHYGNVVTESGNHDSLGKTWSLHATKGNLIIRDINMILTRARVCFLL